MLTDIFLMLSREYTLRMSLLLWTLFKQFPIKPIQLTSAEWKVEY